MNKRGFKFLRITFWIFAFGFSVAAQNRISPANDEQLQIVKAVAPKEYPKAAHITRAQSTIAIEVEINADGSVQSAKFLKGHKLFQAVSKIAARKWRFNSIEDKRAKRIQQISFVYKLIFHESEESEI